ncbi:MAG: TMEM175 family protein [Pirellulales bacterium]
MVEPKQTIERLTMYSDAILAVVATLLVLGIAVPEDHHFSEEGLVAFLAKIKHDIGAYALSFLIIYSFWIQHHVICLFLDRANRCFTWLNCVFLFFLTLIPFATKLLAVYRQDFYVVLIYGVLQVACGVSLAMMWWYVHVQRRMLSAPVEQAVRRSMTIRILSGPILNLAAVGISFFSVPVALALFVGAPLLNLSHRRVDSSLREMAADAA